MLAEAARIESERLAAVEVKWIAAAASRRAAAEKAKTGQDEAKQSAARRFAEIAAQPRVKAGIALEPIAPAAKVAPKPDKKPADTLIVIAIHAKAARAKTHRLFTNQQFQVLQAEGGLDAVRQMDGRVPDVVITDVQMTGMDGYDLTRHVRSNTATAHVPVIMISADKNQATRASRAGVDLLLEKPFSEDVLVAHVRRLTRDGRGKA